jgi:hypothetical protein
MLRNDRINFRSSPGELTIKVNKDTIVLRQGEVFVNQLTVSQLPYTSSSISVKRLTDFYFSIVGKSFRCLFDGIRVKITLEPIYVGNTRGLCGTYNFKISDDFVNTDGYVETDVYNFADGYKNYADQTCTTPQQSDPCTDNFGSRDEAIEYCSLIREHPIFKQCQSVVDPTFYVDSCMYDMCLDVNDAHRDVYRCRGVAAYAEECANKGVVIDWYNNSELDDLNQACQRSGYGYCSGGTLYTECSRLVNTTCRDLNFRSTEKYSNKHLETQCVAGCSCPEGQYLENRLGRLSCVHKESCSCFDSASNRNYPSNSTLKKGCSTCRCADGEWSCDNVDCKDVIICPKNQVFSRNATTCPRTCGNREHHRECDQVAEGCACPQGLILDYYGECVSESQCQCRHAGKLYTNNELVKIGCNTCVCQGGHWSCSSQKCDGVCVAAGDPHYTTYDGLRFSYQGNCKYILTQTQDEKFRVVVENVKCGSTGVTCTKNIFIRTHGKLIYLFFSVRDRFLLNFS